MSDAPVPVLPDPPPPDPDRRVCGRCGDVKPIQDFQNRRDTCSSCFRAVDLARRAERKSERAAELMEVIFDAAQKPNATAPKLETLVAELTSQWGGVSLLARDYYDYMKRLTAVPRPSSSVAQQFMSLFKLIGLCSQAVHEEEVDRMGLEQVERAQKLELVKMLQAASVEATTRDALLEVMRMAGLTEQAAVPALESREQPDGSGSLE